MKAAIYAAKNKVGIVDMPLPEVISEKVKIKMAYCSICASDVHLTEGFFGDLAPFGLPLGHEGSGTIVEIGADVEKYGLKVGDKVVLNPVSPYCGYCKYCKRGLWQYCDNKMDYFVGCMSEYAICDAGQVYKLPDDIDMQVAALTEPLTIALRAMDWADMNIGGTVVISGAGGIGMLLLQLVKLKGGTRVTVIEPVASKREQVLSMGADHVIDPFNEDVEKRALEITDGLGYDYVFEASGSKGATPVCLKLPGKCGKIIYVAVYDMDYSLPVNLFEMYWKEASIQAMFTHPTLFPRAINLLNKIEMDKIIGKVMPLTSVEEAFEIEFKKSIYPKILLDCQK